MNGHPEQPVSIYLCDCHTEGILLVALDDECVELTGTTSGTTSWKEVSQREIALSIWSRGTYQAHTFSFWTRLRWMWRILTKGYPFTDSIILTRGMAKNLAKGLLTLTKE